MTFIRKLSNSLIIFVAIFSLAACSDDKAETTGEKVDEMVHDAGDAMEDAGDKIDEMATDAGNAIEDACENVKDNVNADDKDC